MARRSGRALRALKLLARTAPKPPTQRASVIWRIHKAVQDANLPTTPVVNVATGLHGTYWVVTLSYTEQALREYGVPRGMGVQQLDYYDRVFRDQGVYVDGVGVDALGLALGGDGMLHVHVSVHDGYVRPKGGLLTEAGCADARPRRAIRA